MQYVANLNTKFVILLSYLPALCNCGCKCFDFCRSLLFPQSLLTDFLHQSSYHRGQKFLAHVMERIICVLKGKLYSRLECVQKHQKWKFVPRLLSMIAGSSAAEECCWFLLEACCNFPLNFAQHLVSLLNQTTLFQGYGRSWSCLYIKIKMAPILLRRAPYYAYFTLI